MKRRILNPFVLVYLVISTVRDYCARDKAYCEITKQNFKTAWKSNFNLYIALRGRGD